MDRRHRSLSRARRGSARRALAAWAVVILAGLLPGSPEAAIFGVPNGATNPNTWFLMTGTGSANNDGDAIHTMTFKIEVTGNTLDVQVHDAGNSGARDWNRGSDSTTNYTLRDPAGAILANITIGNDNATTENVLSRLTAAGFLAIGASAPFAVQRGLFELTITMGNNTEVNAFGLSIPGYQVYTSVDVPAGNEDGQMIIGGQNSGGAPVAGVTQPAFMYPYVDRGCSLTTTNYDDDTGGGNPGAGSSGTLRSRLGTNTALTMSGNGVASDNALAAIQQATKAQDYGIWRLDWNSGTQQNLIDWRMADYTGVNIPGAGLPHRPNAPFRIYLPADGTLPGAPVAPVEPRIEQSLTPLTPSGGGGPGGPNPPVAGSTSYFEVNVALTNPTASAMTTVTLTANVPGAPVLYESSNPPLITAGAQVTGGGAISSQPADGGSGNVVATWATVAAGATVSLTYSVAVTPAGAGSINVTATPASGNGTRLTYTPAFQSATFPRTENTGPLCQLSAQAGTAVPNAVALEALDARGYAGQVRLAWTTAAEWSNLGFNVYRAQGPAGAPIQLNRALILGAGTSSYRADYLFVDPDVRDGSSYAYWLEDVDRAGRRTLHGPVFATAGGDPAPAIDAAALDRVAGADGDLSVGALAALSIVSQEHRAPGPVAPARAAASPAMAQAQAPRPIARVLSQDETGMLVEIKVPRARLAPVTLDGAAYTDVTMEGFSHIAEPGHPALPEVGVPIPIPDVADLRIEVEDETRRRIAGPVLPAPAPDYALQPDGSLAASYAPDMAIYGGAAYPQAVVTPGGSVRQGDSRLLVLRIDPVAWDPATGTLTQATRLRARIRFEGARAADARSEPDARRLNQFMVAERGAIRIAVDRTGIQRVSGQALLDAGLPAETDPRLLSLYVGGQEAAILVEGEEDGVLDGGDAIVFHGEALDNDHALARTYWLVPGTLTGARIADLDGTPSGADSGESTTPAVVRLEKNLVYVPFVLNGAISNFVGDSIFQNPRDQVLSLVGVTGGAAELRLRVQGATTDDNVDPDHHLQVSVNGVTVGEARWDGFGAFEGSFVLPPGTLVEGANQVRFTPIADTGALYDFDYVDWVEIRYVRGLGQAGPALAFETSAAGDHTLSDLDGPAAMLLDVTDPLAPERVQGGLAGAGTLAFAAGEGTRRLEVATEAGFVTPASVGLDTPSSLHDAPGTDWLAIAHESLLAGTQPLAALRASEGLRARIVDVQDVYDEFGTGDPDPQAIRDFLAWQYERGGAPRLRYVLLVGDASSDERNWLHGANRNLIPAPLRDGTYTERASDNWYAAFLGDDAVPDVALGRLPVKDAAQLAGVVSKILAYAAQPLGQDWQRSALLVADDGFHAFQAGEAALFEGASDAMARWLPPGFDALQLYLSAIPEADQAAVARQAILDALNSGRLFVSYIGHGAITLWADEVIFRAADLASLHNADRLPFVVVLNCLNGFFNAPSGDALGESMLFGPTGAVAVYAPASVAPIEGQEVMGEAIARAIFRAGDLRIGDALVRARAASAGLRFFDDLAGGWALLGDPATRLAFDALPIADAGDDADGEVRARVTLDGSASGGVPGPLAFSWRIVSAPAGSHASLVHADEARPSLRLDREGTYVVELVVSAEGRSSAPDTVTVRALPRPGSGAGSKARSPFL